MARILAILHAKEEHLGALEGGLLAEGHALEVLAMPGPLPKTLLERGCSGLVVMGGSMAVYEADRYPFLGRELHLIEGALERGLPVLGICLGAQLLAHAGGARVFPGPKTEVGWLRVRRVLDDPWLPDWPASLEPFHWHGDTFDLPPRATLLASSALYENQAFRLGSGLGLQFHVEATAEMVKDWAQTPGLGERWRVPAEHLQATDAAARAMAPLVASLGRAFGRAAEAAVEPSRG